MKTNKMSVIIGIISLFWLIIAIPGNANPVKKTIHSGGFEREYKVYIPQNQLYDKANGILVCLHGFGRTMDDFFDQYDITAIADFLNMVIVAPQALPEQDSHVYDVTSILISLLPDTEISLHSVWGCGLSVRVLFIDEELNKDVDDVTFIDAMIDEVIAEYALSDENIFVLGTSMGGYMTYQYALQKGERLSGIIPIAGSFGLSIKGIDHATKLPVCDFHSLTDEVVPYTGSQTQSGITVSLAKPKEDVINFWRQINSTGDPVKEQVNYYPSTNGITVDKITYPEQDNEVIHYQITGAPHSYFFKKDNGDCMDHAEEIIKFISSHHAVLSHNTPILKEQQSFFYPNPVFDKIYFSTPNGIISIYDISGRMLLTQSFTDGQTNLSLLKPGMYFIRIQSGNTIQVSKLIKR